MLELMDKKIFTIFALPKFVYLVLSYLDNPKYDHIVQYHIGFHKSNREAKKLYNMYIHISSHSAQCCRYQTYSDALKNPPSELFHTGIVFLFLWSIPRPQSLGHSSFSKKHS